MNSGPAICVGAKHIRSIAATTSAWVLLIEILR
jgi:hypothetical protein